MKPIINQTITVSKGRSLGYAEFGDLQGFPVFLFHGQPGNRLFRYPDDAILSSNNIHLITVDRPGFGLSDYQPGRKLLDWPQDVVDLADSLGLERFSVVGFSAGGPHAAVCAYKIPQRIFKAGLVSSAAPMSAPGILAAASSPVRTMHTLVHRAPMISRLFFRLLWNNSRRNPDALIRTSLKEAPPSDRDILSQPNVIALLIETWKENLRVSSRGYAHDFEIMMKDWGFALHDIPAEVFLWQGELDVNSSPAWGHFLAKEIPNCKATFFADEAHFILFSHWKEILQTMADLK